MSHVYNHCSISERPKQHHFLIFHLHDDSVVKLCGNMIQDYLELSKHCCNYLKINLHTAFSQNKTSKDWSTSIFQLSLTTTMSAYLTIIGRFFSAVLDKSYVSVPKNHTKRIR